MIWLNAFVWCFYRASSKKDYKLWINFNSFAIHIFPFTIDMVDFLLLLLSSPIKWKIGINDKKMIIDCTLLCLLFHTYWPETDSSLSFFFIFYYFWCLQMLHKHIIWHIWVLLQRNMHFLVFPSLFPYKIDVSYSHWNQTCDFPLKMICLFYFFNFI